MLYRVDVYCRGDDAFDDSLRGEIARKMVGVTRVWFGRIFLIESTAELSAVEQAAREVLTDPIAEECSIATSASALQTHPGLIEVHLQPGVMDPAAASAEIALRDAGLDVQQVRTGRVYHIESNPALNAAALKQLAERYLANEVIEYIHLKPWRPDRFPEAPVYAIDVRHIPIRNLNDAELTAVSRDGHLFLSLEEMQRVQLYYQQQKREPTDIELETIAQTWSEHCVHKTLKSRVEVTAPDGSIRRYDNLIRDTIFASTQELMTQFPGFCLSVFKDNAGVVAFDDVDAVCFKVETHNHPSAIEPYGGSATGIGGCIRDILGTGLAARPIANTDTFCVAHADAAEKSPVYSKVDALPAGVIHPRRVLQQIVAGVRDYGNRMGIPTVNGAVYFDDRYLANPLVFAGCVGVIPRDKIDKRAEPGDAIVVVGGRTGRDGIHGATFSSAELTSTHADEFSHAVQIGNPITQKKMADVIIRARDENLFTAITDCGAGGLSSAIGEMGEELGADVQLDRAPLKYPGLRYDEIWISEAQERMVLSVPQAHVLRLLELCSAEDVEATVIGTFGVEGRELVLRYADTEVGRLSMEFLHDGLPRSTRSATAPASTRAPIARAWHAEANDDIRKRLLQTLAHPNVASKHWVIRQYDHEVQGGSIVKPLTGPQQRGPSDAAVVHPKLGSPRAVAIGCGLTPHIDDPYWMAWYAVDEAIRNVVCVGGRPGSIAILDNFCWESVADGESMGNLVRACEGCRDAALAYQTPFISGKDSLHNQFTDKATGRVLKIPRTLLISAIAVLEDVSNCLTMDLKSPGNVVLRVSANLRSPWWDALPAVHRAVSACIADQHITSAHDISEGGTLAALAEMCIASDIGARVATEAVSTNGSAGADPHFDETPGAYLLEVTADRAAHVEERLASTAYVKVQQYAETTADAKLTCGEATWTIEELIKAFRGTLDW